MIFLANQKDISVEGEKRPVAHGLRTVVKATVVILIVIAFLATESVSLVNHLLNNKT